MCPAVFVRQALSSTQMATVYQYLIVRALLAPFLWLVTRFMRPTARNSSASLVVLTSPLRHVLQHATFPSGQLGLIAQACALESADDSETLLVLDALVIPPYLSRLSIATSAALVTTSTVLLE